MHPTVQQDFQPLHDLTDGLCIRRLAARFVFQSFFHGERYADA